MDDIVKQAMVKWPNVPDCYGWLGLDARGRWILRNQEVQDAGPFPASRGDVLAHDGLRAFIHRNYAADGEGRWFFQNGPQRVYVELEAAPWIWRVQATSELQVESHTGMKTHAVAAWLDEHGHVYLETPLGWGLVHTLDVPMVAEWVEQGLLQPQAVTAAEVPARAGFVRSPAQGAASGTAHRA